MECVGVLLGGDMVASGERRASCRGGQLQKFAAVEIDGIRHAGILPEVVSAFRRTSGYRRRTTSKIPSNVEGAVGPGGLEAVDEVVDLWNVVKRDPDEE